MFQIESLDRLVHELCQLPSIGPKSAQRLTHFLLKRTKVSQGIRKALEGVEENIRLCDLCYNYTDFPEGNCRLCRNTMRDDHMLCLVEQPEDILQIESSGAYSGRYHVLHGAISPLEGITPDRLKIPQLMERLEHGGETVQEVILALDSDLEGDTTVLYLHQLLSGKDIKVTRLAQGIPMGSDIDYIDDRTLNRALSNRVEV